MASSCGSFRIGLLRQLQVDPVGVGSVVPMATGKKSTARVTLRTVIEHMDRKFQLVDARFTAIDTRFDLIDKRFDAFERRMDDGFLGVNGRIDRLERRLSTQIDNIDKRLDDLETSVVPALKKAVGAR